MKNAAKIMSLLLTAVLVFSVICVCVPVNASMGSILINTTVRPSAVWTMRLGGLVPLYFGLVTWENETLDLYISTNGYSSLSSADIKYGPTFSVAKLKANTIDNTTYPDYSIGKNWINGTIPKSLNIPGGHYYIKAFDGNPAAVATTDNYINIIPHLVLVPDSGPVGTSVIAYGYEFPASDTLVYKVTLYWDSLQGLNLSAAYTDSNRNFEITFVVPQTSEGTHSVYAVANDTESSTTYRLFNVIKYYDLTVHAQRPVYIISPSGSKFAPIKGVNVTIYKSSTLIGSTLTDVSGDAIFSVPEGTYTIVASQHLLLKIHMTKEATITVTEDTIITFIFLI